jgi:hypothetical protein
MAAQPLTGIDALAGDAHPDVALRQRPAAAGNVMGFVGTLATAPVGLPDGGTASSSCAKTTASWRLAPVVSLASGTPPRSVKMCRLAPGLPRSVGLGPVSSPPLWPGCWRSRCRPGSSRSGRPRRADRATRGATPPTPWRPVSRATGASTSPRSRSPSPGAAAPIGCRS